MLKNELWKKIDGFDYEISNMGRIKTLNKQTKKLRNHYYDTILKPFINKGGYLRIELCNRGIKKKFLIHRLVALYFIPNPENKKEVNHKFGDKTKNTINDLEWATSKENAIHSIVNGLKPIRCKLNKLDIKFIKYWLKYGYKQKEIALKFNVNKSTIYDIAHNRTWVHVK